MAAATRRPYPIVKLPKCALTNKLDRNGRSIAVFSLRHTKETTHDEICTVEYSLTGCDACEPRTCAARYRRPWLLRGVLSERKLPKLGTGQSVHRWRLLSVRRQ